MSGINWNVELKKIEREFDGLPPVPSQGAVNARRAAERSAQQRKEAHAAAIGTWARLALVIGLAGALQFWPYARACGLGLYGYMGAELLIAAGGLWVVAWTWRWRMVWTHGVALLLVIAALALVAAEVLPRVGYAAQPAQWRCAASIP